jgi:hypothetical protein
MIDEGYKDLDKLIKNEVKTLGFLRNRGDLAENFSELVSDAQTTYFRYKGKSTTGFNFESHIDVNVAGKKKRVYFGVNVDKATKMVSYDLAIFELNEENMICLRKFHFDYTPKDAKRRTPHPVFHIQYGGKLSPYLCTKFGYNDSHIKHMNPKLSIPRIPHIPMTLALLLNFIFIEFQSEETAKIVGKSDWQSFIKNNEKVFLYPYFEQCHRIINQPSYKGLLTADYFYGK